MTCSTPLSDERGGGVRSTLLLLAAWVWFLRQHGHSAMGTVRETTIRQGTAHANCIKEFMSDTQQVKEKRVVRAHAHIIEFYAAARKISLCIAFPPCPSRLGHEIQLFRDLTETGQISSTPVSFQLAFAESEASNINLNHCLALSQMCNEITSL